MTLDPAQRRWSPSTGRRGDTDLAARARLIKSIAWGGAPGLFFGVVIAARVGGILGILMGVGLAVGLALAGYLVAEGAGWASNAIMHPSAGLTRPPTNSRADALETRGDFQGAVDAWEVTAAEHPTRPEPAARVARLYRDHLGDPEQALVWMKRAVERADFGSEARVPLRELVELARKVDPTGRGAAPMLARYAEKVGNDGPEGEWARSEMARIKEAIRRASSFPS